MVCSVSNMVKDRTRKIGWVAVLCAYEREDKVNCIQLSIEWMDKYVPPIRCTHPISRKVWHPPYHCRLQERISKPITAVVL